MGVILRGESNKDQGVIKQGSR